MLMKGRIIILNNKEQIYIKQEKLHIYEYQNAIILPRKYEDDGPTWGKGGVCSQEGEFVQSSFYDGGWAQNGGKYEWNQTDEIYIDEKVIYIGVFAKHWGHFLVDMTSKLWIFADPEFKENIKDFKVAYIGEEEPEGNYLEFYKILGIGEEDVCGRADLVREEIQFVLDREEIVDCFQDLLRSGKISFRVTHNDTKINNVLMDKDTKKGICVIDLDTVMPGAAMNDFGDAVRIGASTALEDEQNLDKVWFNLELFEACANGFIEGCGGKLSQEEIKLLPMGARLMTYECGMRFLMDYIQGDIYFKIHRPGQNLDRARTQFKLVSDMEHKWKVMENIVKKYM